MTVKPGFVNTRMVAHLKLPALLTSEPDDVAVAIVNAAEKRKDVIYVRERWRFIMLIIMHIPEFIFKKMSI